MRLIKTLVTAFILTFLAGNLLAQETRIPPKLIKEQADSNLVLVTNASGVWTPVAITSLPSTADGSETIIKDGGDISVTGSGTAGDPYVVSFTETTTSIALNGTDLEYTDENGSTTTLDLSTLETTTTLSWNAGTRELSYVDEDGSTTTLTISAGVIGVTEGEQFVIATAAQGTISLSSSYTSPASGTTVSDLRIYRSGLLLREGASHDYTISGSTVTLATALDEDELVTITWLAVEE